MYAMTELELFRCFEVQIKIGKRKILLWKYSPTLTPKMTKPKPRRSVRQLRRFYERYSSLEISPFEFNNS